MAAPMGSELRCPYCEYDVGDVLRVAATRTGPGAVPRCPECGKRVSVRLCTRDIAGLGRRVRWWVLVAWASPSLVGLISLPLHSLLWDLGLRPEPLLFALLAASVLAVYAACWWVEGWLGRGGSVLRALGPTMVVMFVNVIAVVWIVSVLVG